MVLLVGAAWWWSAPSSPVAEPPPTLAAELPVEPAPVEPLEDLEGLLFPLPQGGEGQAEGERSRATILKPRKQALPIVPACVPDADWKKRARADLNELVTRAARSSPELTLWAADREGPLSGAIEAAASARECGAVGLQLAMFKKKVTPK